MAGRRRLASGDNAAAAAEVVTGEYGGAGGMLDGNGRIARLARWLRDKPAKETCEQLSLEVKGEDGYERVQSWPRASVSMALATVIDAMVIDIANEQGSYLQARAVWLDAERGSPWSTFPLRVHPDPMPGQASAAQAFTGEGPNVTIQLQRQLSQVTALHLGGIQETFAQVRDSSEDTRERARRAEQEADRLRERVNVLEAENLALARENAELRDDLTAAMELAEEQSAEAIKAKKEKSENGDLMQLAGKFLGLPTGAAS